MIRHCPVECPFLAVHVCMLPWCGTSLDNYHAWCHRPAGIVVISDGVPDGHQTMLGKSSLLSFPKTMLNAQPSAVPLNTHSLAMALVVKAATITSIPSMTLSQTHNNTMRHCIELILMEGELPEFTLIAPTLNWRYATDQP